MGFRVHRQTFDDPLNRDGWGDEVYAATFVSRVDRTTLALRESALITTRTYGSPGGFPNRSPVDGGIVTGTTQPIDIDLRLQLPGTGSVDQFPVKLWEGVLDATNALVIAPSLWEWDGNATGFVFWRDHEARVLADEATRAAIDGGNWAPRTSPRAVIAHRSGVTQSLPDSYLIVDSGNDRPIGLNLDMFRVKYVVLTRDGVEALLNQSVGGAPGVIEVRYDELSFYDVDGYGGDYSLFLKIERVP